MGFSGVSRASDCRVIASTGHGPSEAVGSTVSTLPGRGQGCSSIPAQWRRYWALWVTRGATAISAHSGAPCPHKEPMSPGLRDSPSSSLGTSLRALQSRGGCSMASSDERSAPALTCPVHFLSPAKPTDTAMAALWQQVPPASPPQGC